MMKARLDLTKWITHFVHARNVENDPAYDINQGEDVPLFPTHEDRELGRRFDLWEAKEEGATWAADEDAFGVLLKIIDDGHIRSGWSFRKTKPTVYGPRAACCFTEMPLYALIEYARFRKSEENVSTFAICLLRQELFAAGGRPAIYGLSGEHKEVPPPKKGPAYPTLSHNWPRKLDPTCGISEDEQYRYVYTNLTGAKPINWSHEREWRWADIGEICSCPGLPVWLRDEPYQFTQVMILVETQKEATLVLDKLKEQYDAGSHNFDYAYSKKTLLATNVVSLEAINDAVTEDALKTIRLEDLPAQTIAAFKQPVVTPEYTKNVEAALQSAHIAAKAAAQAYKVSGGDGFGFVRLLLRSSQSQLASALLSLNEATVIGGVGYWVSDFGKHGQFGSAESSYAGVAAAKSVLEKQFPDVEFDISLHWD